MLCRDKEMAQQSELTEDSFIEGVCLSVLAYRAGMFHGVQMRERPDTVICLVLPHICQVLVASVSCRILGFEVCTGAPANHSETATVNFINYAPISMLTNPDASLNRQRQHFVKTRMMGLLCGHRKPGEGA